MCNVCNLLEQTVGNGMLFQSYQKHKTQMQILAFLSSQSSSKIS